MPDTPRSSGTARRTFLRALALAPAVAAAGCATASAKGVSGGAAKEAATPAPGSEARAAAEALAAIRNVPLALDVEPVFVFRAHAARPLE